MLHFNTPFTPKVTHPFIRHIAVVAVLMLIYMSHESLTLASSHHKTTKRSEPNHKPTALRPAIQKTDPSRYEFFIPNHSGQPDPKQVRLTITGNHFKPGSVAYFNGKAIPTQFVSTTQLTTCIPFDWIASVPQSNPADPRDMQGKALLNVHNLGKTAIASKPYSFPVTATPMGG